MTRYLPGPTSNQQAKAAVYSVLNDMLDAAEHTGESAHDKRYLARAEQETYQSQKSLPHAYEALAGEIFERMKTYNNGIVSVRALCNPTFVGHVMKSIGIADTDDDGLLENHEVEFNRSPLLDRIDDAAEQWRVYSRAARDGWETRRHRALRLKGFRG